MVEIGQRTHPRSRGEHSVTGVSPPSGGDSPPLSRGARAGPSSCRVVSGLTPALAGSTRTPRPPSRTSWTHPPLSRGARRPDLGLHPGQRLTPGSRGEHRVPVPGLEEVGGLTPALAGSTWRRSCWSSCRWTHPRSRGEHSPSSDYSYSRQDSPPLSRGALFENLPSHLGHGLTPALAGSTGRGLRGVGDGGTHPRSRGEHRGLHPGVAAGPGLTPALAGSTR